MKKILFIAIWLLMGIGAYAAEKPKPTIAKAAQNKFAALAIDRDNGFYYGWSFDHLDRKEAEEAAIQGAEKYGAKSPSVVLVWSGTACGAYRTMSADAGTAYGWGVAVTKEAADTIATAEAMKRSGGNPLPNFAWACNSKSSPAKIIYDASPEIIQSVKIKDQVWATENLQVSRFRNGDPIPHTMNPEEFSKWIKENKPGSFCYTEESCTRLGRMYNAYAMMDTRGIAPLGWRVPNKADAEKLIAGQGGSERAGPKLRTVKGWPDFAQPASNSSGFSALAGYQRFSGSKKYWEAQTPNLSQVWTTSILEEGGYRYIHHFIIHTYETRDEVRLGTQGFGDALPIRLIKE